MKGKKMFKYEFGEVLKDKVTGFMGVVMCRTQYATGCVHYGLLRQGLDEKGMVSDWVYFDENRLMPTGEQVIITPDTEDKPGGPSQEAPQIN